MEHGFDGSYESEKRNVKKLNDAEKRHPAACVNAQMFWQVEHANPCFVHELHKLGTKGHNPPFRLCFGF